MNENLKSIRKASGLSQIELARRAKVSRFRISLAESGTIQLLPEEIAAVGEVILPELKKTKRFVTEVTAATRAR